MTVDSMNRGFAGHVSLGIDTFSNNAHIRASIVSPTDFYRGKQELRLEVLRDRRMLYDSRVHVSFRLGVSIARSDEIIFLLALMIK